MSAIGGIKELWNVSGADSQSEGTIAGSLPKPPASRSQ
jgi:hypothetical protein